MRISAGAAAAAIKMKSMTERKRYLILVAGGSGTRMGGQVPKQFLETGGKAILHHTIDKFTSAVRDLSIITVLPEEWIDYWKSYCYRKNLVCRQVITAGGITRFHSVKNALGKVPDGVTAAVHDGVRPLLSEGLARRLFSLADTFPAVVPVIPLVDTVKVLKKASGPQAGIYEAIPGETADRTRLFGAQTPQVFHSEILKEAYSMPYSTELTDDASVVERHGEKILYCTGEKYNIKITTPEDMGIAELLLK